MAENKKAVLIIAKETFRDEELFETQEAIESFGIATTIASSIVGTCKGKLGRNAQSEVLVSDLSADDYDSVIFVGGGGAMEYYDNDDALGLAKDACAKGKIVAAICIGPRILANAGLLKSRKATCFESEADAIKQLGADFTGNDVEVDGRIITANGPHAATDFGTLIAKAVLGSD